MTTNFQDEYNSLSPIQRDAVDWDAGAALVLAGPGAGKTKVLTTRIARLLTESAGKKFKILALTFTTKAAAEMRTRVESLVPDEAEDRTLITTFHAFCTQILRQHGSHIGIQPDFGIYDQRADREALLLDALREAIEAGEEYLEGDVRWLDAIEEMKRRLVTPEKVGTKIRDPQMAKVYALYEAKLRSENVMDFNGLILEACRLLAKMPALGVRLRSSYRYWLIDEFQDTSRGQYLLLHYLSGDVFKEVFAVADDDQIIYQWAGASYRQIEKFRDEYKPTLIQLVENHRCPPEIVEIANRLVAHNTQRAPEKKPTVPARDSPLDAIAIRHFATDKEEVDIVSDEILSQGEEAWGRIAILGRTRSLLEPMLACLQAKGVRATLLQRRDTFISPQFVWLQACLDQALRPTNKRMFTVLVNAANRVTGLELDPVILIAEAEAVGHSFFEHWGGIAQSLDSLVATELGKFAQSLAQSRNTWKDMIKSAIPILLDSESVAEGAVSDAADDFSAWKVCMKEMRLEKGQELELGELVQGLALRSKEPPRDPNSVALMTIHSSKGLEFDVVYVIGLAEGEMPSWQSLKQGDVSPAMEEERRNCFVAITRTRESLTLSRAENYRGWVRKASRFLKEMTLID
ncbi:MAG TPA: ATP-dependent helicase [Blastocatellia bacterium]|nr:ATP-dependent helicase [Blastocatellia bacterium]